MTSPTQTPDPTQSQSRSHADTLPHADLTSVDQMHADCCATGARLELARAARRATRPALGITVAEQPRETPKRDLQVSAAAARLAGAIYGTD